MLKELAPFLLTGFLQELLWISSYYVGPFRENTGAFLALMFGSFALCAWSYFRLPLRHHAAVLTVLGFALLFRLTVLPAPPHESEDVYRYIWDARIATAGIDPFRYPPEAPQLERFRDAVVFPKLNSKPYTTVYPPFSQILFRISYALFGESVAGMKSIFSLFEFSTLLLAWRLLEAYGERLEPLFFVAWNPFFVFEFSHSGHSESAMMFLILLSAYLLLHSKKAWAMVSYAAAVLVKLHPALLFPLYHRRVGWKPTLAGIATGSVLLCAFFTPRSLVQYVSSLRLYYKVFEFNASVHYVLRMIGREVYQESWDQLTGPYLGAGLVLVCVLIWWRFPRRSEKDLLHAGFWIMTANVCLSTTVHPWYLAWAALALPFFPYAFMAYWTGASFLSYAAYAYRPVYEPTWVLLVEYLPMYALMAWEIRRGKPLLRLTIDD